MVFRALILLCLIWGFNFVVMKTANFYFSPELFVTYRFGLGAIVLLAVAWFSKIPLPPKKLWGWIFLSAAFQISVGSMLCQYSFKFLPAGLVSMLNYTMPVWVSILAYFFLSEKLTQKKIFGIILSIVGIGVLMNVNVSGSRLGSRQRDNESEVDRNKFSFLDDLANGYRRNFACNLHFHSRRS